MRAEARPLIIARGGASADAPEHTIAAFELALAQGADGILLDVHLSRDAQPVVIRDFTLESTSDGAGAVNDHSVRELKRLDAGGWRGRAFRGQRIQTLQEVLERFRGRTRFWVTLRGGMDLYPGIEERVVSTVEIYEALDTCVAQSLDRRSVARMRELSAEVRLGAIVTHAPPHASSDAYLRLSSVSTESSLVTEEGVAAARGLGLDYCVWIADEPARLDRLVNWGITGIITDRPGRLRARLAARRDST
jgi:glycerophosphoryl diester phosphodiesterase